MKRSILLVDDSKFMRRANELALLKAGFGVFSAGDGEEGLRVAREKLPDLIVLDMMLPKLSGPQLLDALKQRYTLLLAQPNQLITDSLLDTEITNDESQTLMEQQEINDCHKLDETANSISTQNQPSHSFIFKPSIDALKRSYHIGMLKLN